MAADVCPDPYARYVIPIATLAAANASPQGSTAQTLYVYDSRSCLYWSGISRKGWVICPNPQPRDMPMN
jgi:hypothetical protein